MASAWISMFLGRVVGSVWATAKNPQLEGIRLLLVQPVTATLDPSGRVVVCTDSTGAGAGEIVYWVRGREATFPFRPQEPPTDATVVAIVGSVRLDANAGKPSRKLPAERESEGNAPC